MVFEFYHRTKTDLSGILAMKGVDAGYFFLADFSMATISWPAAKSFLFTITTYSLVYFSLFNLRNA